jgi:phosphoribosylanthranilate isomerase
MKLKVCGMKYSDNIKEVAALQPDYLGFIFWKPSKRYFEGSIPETSANIKKVGVFVNAPLEVVIFEVDKHNLQAVQLHGNESPEYCKELEINFVSFRAQSRKKKVDQIPSKPNQKSNKVEIIKVFSIRNGFDFKVLKPYEDVCDYFLFDTKGELPGGNGYKFDWKLLENYPSKKPYFLSGGIGLHEKENVKSFLHGKTSKYCYAIDVNSKFEIEPGLKSAENLKEFIKNI